MANIGDVFHDIKYGTFFVIEIPLESFDSYAIRILNKTSPHYKKPLMMIGKENLTLSRFVLVGRNAVIK